MEAPNQTDGLKSLGLENLRHVGWDLSTSALYEEALRRGEGILSHLGPLVVRTGQYTGRLPRDKFIVREPSSEGNISWGKVNRALDPAHFETLKNRLRAYFQGRDVFVQNCYAGADENFRVRLRVITERAAHALFARNMFLRGLDRSRLSEPPPDFTILHAPGFRAEPAIDGTRSEAFIVLHFGAKLGLIGGTAYAGEMKKSVFTLMNFLLPAQDVLPMHCSANYGTDPDDAALFFGLSGTGKTTLSASPDRTLVGDDEHGWSDEGIFNFEGGCYAKVIRLSREGEPEIFEATVRFGTLLENVVTDPQTRHVNLDDNSLTENTRAAYPIAFIPRSAPNGRAGHPRQIIMLTCDAFGVLPPIARLTPEQAMYQFLSGYTAKVAGTESGVTEPQVTFSACFGAPFMALRPTVYARMLGQKLQKHQVEAWLINTGWTGGPHGEGQRIPLNFTRLMVRNVLGGALKNIPTRPDPVFGLHVPAACPGVPTSLLNPRATWKNGAAYAAKARELAARFKQNFEEYADAAPPGVRAAGPQL